VPDGAVAEAGAIARNQITERAQATTRQVDIVAILKQGRENARLGIRPTPRNDDELRQLVRTRADAILIERLIAGRRRYQESLRKHAEL
jgi:hypothetical protein